MISLKSATFLPILGLCVLLLLYVPTAETNAAVSGRDAFPSSSSVGANLELRYRFEEEQPVGTTLGNVARDANLARLFSPDVLRQLSFRFLKQSQSEFTIDSTTGIIRSAARIDRETLCPSSASASGLLSSSSAADASSAASSGSCEVRLDVAVQPLPYFRIIRVTASIVDVNDNAPRFAADQLNIDVLESVPVGAEIFAPDATDLDSPEFGVQSYRLLTETDQFTLTSSFSGSSGSGSTQEMRLVLTKPLDREKVDSYRLRIVAIDGGFPPKSGTVDLTITVADINDNSPVFDQSAYEASIPENVPQGTTFIRLSAVDDDADLNGQVTYAFAPNSASAYGHLFAIDATSGEVSVRGAIDYEDSPAYRLIVIARDQGGGRGGASSESRSTSVPLVIHVIDMNDNAPSIAVDTLSSTPGVAEIAENSPPGSFVAHLSVSDRDAGNNGRFACHLEDVGEETRSGSMLGSTYFRLAPMYGSSEEFQIATAVEFDRESRDQYELDVTCRDFGAEAMTSSARIMVQVTDQNDNNPVFGRTTYLSELIENNYVGAVLLQVNATDADLGENADIRYSIAPGDPAAAWFDIDPVSGVVTAGVSFDREEHEVVRFNVIARDRAGGSGNGAALARSSTAHVTVTIVDVNDVRPNFSHPYPNYSFSVSENRPAGTTVGQVVARDADSSVYGELTYYIVVPSSSADSRQNSLDSSEGISANSGGSTSGSSSLPFDIDYRTGILTTSKILDRELSDPVYHLIVGASDRGVPPLSGTASVTIYVTDENDNRPNFLFPTPFNRTIHVSTRAPVNHVIGRLIAHDSDVGRNAQISYSIESTVLLDETGSRPTTGLNQAGSGAAAEKLWTGSSYFDVDAERGAVIVNRPLTDVDGRTFELQIVASDQGVPAQMARETLNIVVNRSIALFFADFDTGSPDQHNGNGLNTSGQQSAFHMLIGSRNFIVVVALAGISLAVAIALIIAIIVVRSQDRHDGDRSISSVEHKSTSGCVTGGNKYNCRTETIKMLRTQHQISKETAVDDVTLQVRGKCCNVTMMTENADCGKVGRCGGSQSPQCDCNIDVNGTIWKKNLVDDMMERSGQPWPSTNNQEFRQDPQACSSLLNETASTTGGCITPSCGGNNYQQVHVRYPVAMESDAQDQRTALEVNRLLASLQQMEAVVPLSRVPVDTDSDHSGDGSNTDSGRGTSEVENDTTGRGAKAAVVNGSLNRSQHYYDPRLRQFRPTPTDSPYSMNQDGGCEAVGSGSQVLPDAGYFGSAHSYSPSGVEPGHLSTFGVNGCGRPSTPPVGPPGGGRYFTTSNGRQQVDDPSARNNPAAASLDRKLLQAQFPVSATILSTRYAADACTDDLRSGKGSYVYQGCPAATIQRTPSSPGTSRRNPLAVRPPPLTGFHNNACGRLDDSVPSTVADGTALSSGIGQYSSADISEVLRDDLNVVSPLSDRTKLSNGITAGFYGSPSVNCNTVNPEDLCKEIDKLFFKA